MDSLEGTMAERLSSGNVLLKQQRIAKLAKQIPGVGLTSLSHHIDIEWLKESFRRTRKDGARGVDGQDGRAYEQQLDENLDCLLSRAKKGDSYRAPPVRRVYIPKGDGQLRPLGIPTFEDKVLQRAVLMALEPLYEQDFLDCSYGFRPGRSAHQAQEDLRNILMDMHGGWIVELDIRSFYDSVDHAHLQRIVRQRVRDGVILRLIGKWLNAGVLEDGRHQRSEIGTPQGGVISPLLANVYLHSVLDTWFEGEVKPRLRGRAEMVRYADDVVLAFSNHRDAERFLSVVALRFARFGLSLHPKKTRLFPFERPPLDPQGSGGRRPKPGTFDFLGFTHFWSRSRQGKWVIKVKTAKSRLARAFRRISGWLKRVRHWRIDAQHAGLCRKLLGHNAYFGVTHNYRSLLRLRWLVVRAWKRWLCRRSQRHRLTWPVMNRLLRRYPLPKVTIVHAYATQRSQALRSRMR